MKKIWEIKSLKEYREIHKNMFENHVAKYEKLPNGNDCIIEFMNPIQREHWMRFVYIDGVLNINGDYGYAVFNWYNKENHILAYPTFKDIGYIMSKCVSSKHEDRKGFDMDLFHDEFKKFIEERKEEGCISEDTDNEDYDIPYCEDENDVINHFKHCGDKYGEDIWETGAFELGTFLSERPYIWWHGLCSALEQLEKNKIFELEK